MGSQQFKGKTVEEATKIALEDLNANLEEVKIEVVSPGKSGILGLGGEPAIINVSHDDKSKPKKATRSKPKAKETNSLPQKNNTKNGPATLTYPFTCQHVLLEQSQRIIIVAGRLIHVRDRMLL